MQQLAVSKLPVSLAALLGAVVGALGVRSLGFAGPLDRLQCRQLEIVGDDGTTAIRLGRTDGESAVSLFDSHGRERLRLRVADGPEADLAGMASVELLHLDGDVAAEFAIEPQNRQHGSHVALSIHGGLSDEWNRPIPLARLGTGTSSSSGGVGLTLFEGEHGHRLVSLEAETDAGSKLYLIGSRPVGEDDDPTADSKHAPCIFLDTRAVLDPGDAAPLLGVSVGGARATLGIRPRDEGGPSLQLTGSDGRTQAVGIGR